VRMPARPLDQSIASLTFFCRACFPLMWHGALCRLHEGGTIYLEKLKNETYANEPCCVVCFHPAKERWEVRPQHPRFKGKGILVKEENICFSYCLLPGSLRNAAGHSNVADGDEGVRGRGLISVNNCAGGADFFEEHPFLLASGFRTRWFSYVAMMRGAARQDAAVNQALQDFNDLSCGDMPQKAQELREAALALFKSSLPDDDQACSISPAAREAEVAAILAVLLRWEANQFDFKDGPGKKLFALLRLGCRMNHSCCPNVMIDHPSSAQRPGLLVTEDGRYIVRAVRDITAGEALCHNYGPEELLDWQVEKRRAHLFDRHGFVCQCQRCALEC